MAHNILVKRERTISDVEHQDLTEELINTSLDANILTPVVSISIEKPSRSRRSTPVKEIKFKFRRLQRPAKIISMTLEENESEDLADEIIPKISFFEGITKIHTEKADFCFTLPQRR